MSNKRCSNCIYAEISSTSRPCKDCERMPYGGRKLLWESAYETIESKPTDNPISPNHYSRFKIQPAEYAAVNGLTFEQGNVVKYVTRYKFKNGVEDLKKASKNIEVLIALEEGRDVKEVLKCK